MIHRLFAAIRPPAPVIERLLALQDGVTGARWQGAAQLHLTLRFFGEVETGQAEDLVAALEGVRTPPFTLALREVGHFEKKSAPHTLWAGLAPSDTLAALHRQVEAGARRAGLPPEGRKFAPHITLARLNRGSGPVLSFMQAHGALQGEPWPVEAFDLMESTLAPEGARYKTIRRYRLLAD